MFNKPLIAVTASDIDQIIKDRVPESDVVEFKEALPAKDGVDAWYNGADKMGDRARDAIVHEVLAFANAHGGTLILGIEESDDNPKRAVGLKLIPRCADLAARLPLIFRDVVEPTPAPYPEVVPVCIEGNDGVIIIRVTRSLNAPHRHKVNLRSYIRRGEHSQQMTMREIQDLTLQVERGQAAIDHQFFESGERFQNIASRPSMALGLRATAVPLSPMRVPVPYDSQISPKLRQFSGHIGTRRISVIVPQDLGTFRPILRGIRASNTDDRGGLSVEVRESGLLEIFYSRRRTEDQPSVLYLAWFIGIACNALVIVDELRAAADAPGTEYGLELAVHDGGSLAVGTYGGREYGFLTNWTAGSIVFPRYAISATDKFPELVQLIESDFWNAAGVRRSEPPVAIEF